MVEEIGGGRCTSIRCVDLEAMKVFPLSCPRGRHRILFEGCCGIKTGTYFGLDDGILATQPGCSEKSGLDTSVDAY